MPTCNATTRRSRFIVPQHSTALRRVHKLSRRSHSQGAAVDRQTDGRQRRQIDRQTERDGQKDGQRQLDRAKAARQVALGQCRRRRQNLKTCRTLVQHLNLGGKQFKLQVSIFLGESGVGLHTPRISALPPLLASFLCVYLFMIAGRVAPVVVAIIVVLLLCYTIL